MMLAQVAAVWLFDTVHQALISHTGIYCSTSTSNPTENYHHAASVYISGHQFFQSPNSRNHYLVNSLDISEPFPHQSFV